MKLPISKEDLKNLPNQYDGVMVLDDIAWGRIQVNGMTIDIWYNTGTFKNKNTNYKAQGLERLSAYLKACKELKPKREIKLTLEARIEQLEKRVELLDEAIKSII